MTKLIEVIDLGEYVFEVYNDRVDFPVHEVNQIHSDTILLEDLITDECKADGIISSMLSTPLAIKTADCLPIAIIGETGCALIHAGWRGLEQNILSSQLLKKINPIKAYVGPHISVDNYEVGSEFKEYFCESEYFIEVDDSLHLNLSAIALKQLKNEFANIDVSISSNCTYANDDFNSYRRNKTNQRNWNILRRK